MSKVLAIDAEEAILPVIRALLERRLFDCAVMTARSAADGINLAETELPDVVLLDVMPSAMDGCDVCRKLKGQDATCRIPIVVLADVAADSRGLVDFFEAGADACVTKPINEFALAAQIKTMLRLKKAEDILCRQRDPLRCKLCGSSAEPDEISVRLQNELKYRAMVEDQADLVVRFLPDGTLTFVNRAYGTCHGKRPEDLIGQKFWSRVPAGERAKLKAYLACFSVASPVGMIELPIVDGTGEIRWQQWSNRAVFSECGEILEFQSVGRDISELEKVQKALADSERRYRILFNSVRDSLFIHEGPTRGGMPGRFIEVNDSACERLGYTREELLRMTPLDIDAPETIERIPLIMEKLMEKRQFHWEGVHLSKTGERIEVEISAHIFELDGKLVIFSHIRDISERKKTEKEKEELEAQLRRAQKLEAIGTLAGGIAHDFNNILAPIIGYAEMAIEDVSDQGSVRRDVEQILKAAHRAGDLVKQILAFSRPGEQQHRVPLDVSVIVREALKLLRASLPTLIEIRQNIQQGMAMIDPTQIHQVLINLCTNAAHALGGRGVLEVCLERTYLDEADLMSPPFLDLQPGPYLKLRVADSGCGIDPNIIPRIFDPYFTTKEACKGSGLGLAVVNGIVKRHEGAIAVHSRVGEGTTFDVYIPRIANTLTMQAKTIPKIPTGVEHILFVDDEPMVTSLGRLILERLGYRVTAVTSPLDALEVFLSNPHQFELCIMDYTMPHMSGTELSQEILKIRPDLPIILCTGYNENLTEERVKHFGIKAFAVKPLSRIQLAEVVRNVLDQQKKVK